MSTTQRFIEIDILRAIAIVLMIIYHIFFDAWFLGLAPINLNWLPLVVMGRAAGWLFLTLVGVSLVLVQQKYMIQKKTQRALYTHLAIRGGYFFGLGLVISAITWLIVPEYWIVFGVLHCIGLSILFSLPFLAGKLPVEISAVVVLLLGFLVDELHPPSFSLIWLGLTPIGFKSLDYFPLLPYFGLVLLGIVFGRKIYPQYQRQFQLPQFVERLPIFKRLTVIGQHSLLIYFLHQPIILGILFLSKL